MKRINKETIYGLSFVGVWIVGFILLTLYPLLQTFIYSFQKIRIDTGGIITENILFENFKIIFSTDLDFINKLRDFIIETFLYIPLMLIFSCIAAILLNQKIKGRAIFRAIYFLPVIIVSGPVVSELFNRGTATVSLVEQYQVIKNINELLPEWLANPVSSLFSELIFILWMCGVPILIFLSGLQKIDYSIYEAAKVDGADSWICFWKVTLPGISSLIKINALYSIVSLATFSNNDVLKKIRNDMFSSTTGYGYASAEIIIYLIAIILILLVFFGIMKVLTKKEKR